MFIRISLCIAAILGAMLFYMCMEEVSDLEQLEIKYIAYSSLEANRDVMYYLQDLKLCRWEYDNIVYKHGHYKLTDEEIKQYIDYIKRVEQENVESPISDR